MALADSTTPVIDRNRGPASSSGTMRSNQLKRATDAAQPKDIADIVVSEPVIIRVKPGDKK